MTLFIDAVQLMQISMNSLDIIMTVMHLFLSGTDNSKLLQKSAYRNTFSPYNCCIGGKAGF